MICIFDTLLYKSKSLDINKLKWKQNFIIKLFFSIKFYNYKIVVLRDITYKNNQKKTFISFNSGLLENKLSKIIIKRLLNKYGYRMKIFRIITSIDKEITNSYIIITNKLVNLFKNTLPTSIIKFNIIPFLYLI
jgi:hypothetical protein